MRPAALERVLEAKRSSAEDAIQAVKSGDRVFVGTGCAAPRELVKALTARAPHLYDVEIIHMLTRASAEYVKESAFRHNAFFIGKNVRDAVQRGEADYTPVFFYELPRLMRTGSLGPDVALLQLSMPDAHGELSFGIHVDIQRAALDRARIVIAEINPYMPRTCGDASVHISRIDHVVMSSEPLPELKTPPPDPITDAIAANVARLIPNGACLQLGIGRVPERVPSYLTDRNNLGVHTDFLCDAWMPLFLSGSITNKKKRMLPDRSVVSYAMGSRALYDFVNENPDIEFFGADLVADPRMICRNDRMISVNSAMQVDITGQVCSDSVDGLPYSGVGGQTDFVRGAAMSRGGRPIIALPSTAKQGQVSRIVPFLPPGAGVVTSRADAHYVVTEYGTAYLHGKTIRQRALALISIAHPDVRGDLLRYAKSRNYVIGDEPVVAGKELRYPAELEHEKRFGRKDTWVRPLKSSDERMLQDFFYSHKPDTIYNRYFNPKKELGHKEASVRVCVDYHDQMALGVFEMVDGEETRLLAVGRYFLDHGRNMGETALVVHEGYRRLGISRHLTQTLERYAKSQGLIGFFSDILPSNTAILELHRRMGHDVVWDVEERVFHVTNRFASENTRAP